MIDRLEKIQCTGCKSCGDICPKKAISYKTDQEGFWYPEIDYNKCIKCGLCEKACPTIDFNMDQLATRERKPRTLKAYNKDESIRIRSTSGGIYYALAEKFIKNNGLIAGCIYNDDWSGARHIVADDIESLNKIFGSKYFQSDTQGVYDTIKKKLIEGKQVLFCGAPCQVAALYSFLGKDYSNLTTIDFICRGINSPKAYTAYMNELKKKYKSEIKKVQFKNKTQGWLNLGTRVEFENGKVYFRNRHTDPWVNGFINGNLYMRPSCTKCAFKTLPRVADISFGDFWGIKFTKDEALKGVSLVFTNTEKGQHLMDDCSEAFVLEERSLEEAIKGNPAILNAIPMGAKRKDFFECIDSEPFSSLVWRLIGWSSPIWQLRYILIRSKEILKSVLGK